jgi:CRP-like cAMP-binding protein
MRLMSKDDKLTKLALHPLLAGCRRVEVAQVARVADEVWAEPGSVITRRGQTMREFVMVAEGNARVFAGDRPVASIGPGSWLGDRELIARRRSDFDVVASTDMTLFVVPQQAFSGLIRRIPTLTTRLLAAAFDPPMLPTKAQVLSPGRVIPVPARA